MTQRSWAVVHAAEPQWGTSELEIQSSKIGKAEPAVPHDAVNQEQGDSRVARRRTEPWVDTTENE